jgi:N-acetylneuraminic acid mutarotase
MDGKVYYGGGETVADESENSYCYLVQCYDPSQDKWTTLSQLRLPVRYFGLGQIDGHLVAIGGEMKSSTNNGTFERSKGVQRLDGNTWMSDKIPPMSSALLHPAVISHKSSLIVAGGEYFNEIKRSVEIFRLGEGRWFKTNINSLPTASSGLSVVSSVSDNKHYALGGTNDQGNLNQALYVSTEDLYYNSTEQESTSNLEQSALFSTPRTLVEMGAIDASPSRWKILPDTPTYSPAVSLLGGSLVALGGWNKEGSKVQASIMRYSTGTNSWIYIGDLPTPGLAKTTAAVLSLAEILVIGGWDGTNMSSTVYKISLLLE